MSSRRSSRVRTKVVALLLSLTALWGFAAFVTAREGLNLLWLTTLDDNVGRPSEDVVHALQDERRLSLIYLGGGTAEQRAAMLAQRRNSDEVITTFRTLASSSNISLAASDLGQQRINETFTQLDKLPDGRAAIDAGRPDRASVAAMFTGVLDSVFQIYDSLGEFDDKNIAKDVRTLIDVFRAQELLAQEDALLAGVLATGQFRGTEHADFVRLVGAQRFLFAESAAELPAADRARYQQLVVQPAFIRYRGLEDRVVNDVRLDGPAPITADDWKSALDPVVQDLTNLQTVGTDAVVKRSEPIAIAVIVRVVLAGVLGLIAVIASIVISITTARNLVRQLERLRNAARDLASYRLPRVVERLQHGERVDVDAEAPPLDFGRDEIGQVGEAFNQVQETAIRVAVEQAELRRSVRDVFLSLARRSQALLHRQLGLLDAMERRATDSEELAELFRIDHLATRMRRNAENLIVLSGATAGRAWRKPVAMVDVLRGALAEVEDYTRVTVLPVGSASLLGRAVGDVIHLLAELIENAVSFSPPQTVVRVGGSVVGYGFAIEIEDRGLGMSAEEIESANEQLRNPPEFRLTSTARLGLYVVGKLSERHGIKVRLTESPYGGTTAIVLLPGTLMADDGGAEDPNRIDLEQLDDGRSVQLAGIGRHRLEAEVGPGITPPALAAAAGVMNPAAAPAGANGHAPNGQAPNGHAPASQEPGVPDQHARNGQAPNGQAPNGFGPNGASAPPALTPVTPLGGTPALPGPSSTTPNGLPTRPVPSQPTGPSTMDSATATTVTQDVTTRDVVAPDVVAPPVPVVAPEPPRLTPSGLPWRQRPASPAEAGPAAAGTPTTSASTSSTGPTAALAGPPVGWTAVAAGEPSAGDPIAARPPDQTRSLLSSYRSGTLRGRSEAARLATPGAPGEPAVDTPPGDTPQGNTHQGNTPQWTEPPTGPLDPEPTGPTPPTAASGRNPRTTEEEG